MRNDMNYDGANIERHGCPSTPPSTGGEASPASSPTIIVWTPEREAELSEMRAAGKTIREIAEHFGGTHSAVERKLRKMGLVRPAWYRGWVPTLTRQQLKATKKFESDSFSRYDVRTR